MQGEDTARKHSICLLISRPLGWLHTAKTMAMMMVSVGKNEQQSEPSSDAVGAFPTVEHYMVISHEFLHRNSIFSNNLIMKTQSQRSVSPLLFRGAFSTMIKEYLSKD